MKIIKVPKGQSFRSKLIVLKACRPARKWVGRKSLNCAWRDCERADWLMWLAVKVGVDHKQLVLAACDCARLVLHEVHPEEHRPLEAIETAEAWCRGEATIEQVKIAAYASASYASASYSDTAASSAAYSAAHAAYAADRAAYASAFYASAADRAAAFAAQAGADPWRLTELVRERISVEDVERGLTKDGIEAASK